MNLEILRSTTPRFKYYRRIETSPKSSVQSSNSLKFFYIGRDFERVHSLLTIFEAGQCAENYDSAKLLLEKSREIQSITHIPVIYNTTPLTTSNIQALRKQKLVDDILDIDKCGQYLVNKIQMLNRLKGFNNNGQTTKKITIESNEDLVVEPGSVFKRIFDIVVSSILLLLALPFLLLIAIAIRLESSGPIFYSAYRAGRGYKIFKFFKFRTMHVGADQKLDELCGLNQYKGDSGPVFFKADNDPRITKVGAFLRNTSLDELPQFINVLKGDMSLVGNRPLPLYEAAALTTDQWAERFMAPAGITGLWQIKKRGQKDMSATERINLDIAYAHQYSFMYDLWIIANTPSALMQKSNV